MKSSSIHCSEELSGKELLRCEVHLKELFILSIEKLKEKIITLQLIDTAQYPLTEDDIIDIKLSVYRYKTE